MSNGLVWLLPLSAEYKIFPDIILAKTIAESQVTDIGNNIILGLLKKGVTCLRLKSGMWELRAK